MRTFTRLLLGIIVTFVASISAQAQLPFYTDDTDTTPQGKFHLEISSEYDWLSLSSLPGTHQNTAVLTLNYGLTRRIELGVNGPLIKIYKDRKSVV